MGLNDQREKITYAWEQLEIAPYGSEQYEAAYEHLRDHLVKTKDCVRLLEIDTRKAFESLVDDSQTD